jgi:hypothetical protein
VVAVINITITAVLLLLLLLIHIIFSFWWVDYEVISLFNITFLEIFIRNYLYPWLQTNIINLLVSLALILFTYSHWVITFFLCILQPFLREWMVLNRWWEFWFVHHDTMWLMVEAGLLCLLFMCKLCWKSIKIFKS